MLIAENFPAQVITTARWLTDISGGAIEIECHHVSAYRSTDSTGTFVSFDRFWPVDDLSDRFLTPHLEALQQAQEKKRAAGRRDFSVHVIVDNQLIPPGAQVQLNLKSLVSPHVVDAVDAWVSEEPTRGLVTFHHDRSKPLEWSYAPGQRWSASRLAKRIIAKATGGPDPASIAGGDAWLTTDAPSLTSHATMRTRSQARPRSGI